MARGEGLWNALRITVLGWLRLRRGRICAGVASVQGRNVSFSTADTPGHFRRLCYLKRAFSQDEWFEPLGTSSCFRRPCLSEYPKDHPLSYVRLHPLPIIIPPFPSSFELISHLLQQEDPRRPISAKVPRSSNKLRWKRFGATERPNHGPESPKDRARLGIFNVSVY